MQAVSLVRDINWSLPPACLVEAAVTQQIRQGELCNEVFDPTYLHTQMADLNVWFHLSLEQVTAGIVSSLQISVDLSATPWLSMDAIHNPRFDHVALLCTVPTLAS